MGVLRSIIGILFLISGLYIMYKFAKFTSEHKEKIDSFLKMEKDRLCYPEIEKRFLKYFILFIICMLIFSSLI